MVVMVCARIANSVLEQQMILQAKDQIDATKAMGALTSNHRGLWVRGACDKDYLQKVELQDADGRSVLFCSFNPALAQRKFNEHFSNDDSVIRMTSDNPMNPGNSLKGFDKDAFSQFSNDLGKEEAYEFSDGYFNYSVPVFHNASCINCHGASEQAPQAVIDRYGDKNGFNFQQGDLAGVITVRKEMPSFIEFLKKSFGFSDLFILLISFSILPIFSAIYIARPILTYNEKMQQLIKGYEFGEVDESVYPAESKNEVAQLYYAGEKLSKVFKMMGKNYVKMRDRLKSN
ncbi:MAG: DUF3365 domain-containing protein [Cellvibrionaceae bacterium]|nr:DUF3365 domain-containing protein [Cellvibrionaceae bacterium]